MITEISNGTTKHYWKCIHCGFVLGGKVFKNAKARIHLSGNAELRCGQVAKVCRNAPGDVKQLFEALERKKREERDLATQKRKRAQTILKTKLLSPPTKQSKLRIGGGNCLDNDAVDEFWGRAFFGLDLPANKIAHPLFREAIAATKRSKFGFVYVFNYTMFHVHHYY